MKVVCIGKWAKDLRVTGPLITQQKNTFTAMHLLTRPRVAFPFLKRGIYGIYQHVSEDHLHRYLAEFDFRHNNRIALGIDDVARADRAIKGAVGKRLTYRTVNRQAPEAEPA